MVARNVRMTALSPMKVGSAHDDWDGNGLIVDTKHLLAPLRQCAAEAALT